MKPLNLLLALLIAASSSVAHACGALPPAEYQAVIRADLEKQRALATDLAAAADFVALAKALHVASDGSSASFELVRELKGSAAGRLEGLKLPGLVSVSCRASTWFSTAAVRPGEIYVVYVSAGEVTRAGSTAREPDELPLQGELRIIRSAAPNNSSKPTPLRGAA